MLSVRQYLSVGADGEFILKGNEHHTNIANPWVLLNESEPGRFLTIV